MARLRMVEITPPSNWTEGAGTRIFDLDFIKPITQIQVFGTFKAATTTWANRPAANFTKIEIVDGSTVLYSGTGQAVQGHDMQSTGKSPQGYQHLRNTKSVGVAINLNFGRSIGDIKYAFDPKKFKNPQLKVTFDENVHNTSTVDNEIYIKALVFDDISPSPVGFLRLFEVQAFTPGSGSWETVDLPVDKSVRYIYFNALISQTALSTTVDEVKLTEDADERVPYDDNAYKIMRMVNKQSELFHENFRIHVATTGDTYFSAIGSIIGGTAGSYDAAKACGIAAHMGGSFKMRVETGSQYYTAKVEGYNPNGMFMLPVCDPEDDTTFFNAAKLGTWQLKLKGGTAVGTTNTIRVYVEQLHRY